MVLQIDICLKPGAWLQTFRESVNQTRDGLGLGIFRNGKSLRGENNNNNNNGLNFEANLMALNLYAGFFSIIVF